MAKAKKGVDKSKNGESHRGEEPPSGFTEQVASTERAAGWVIKNEGVIVQGRLLSRQEMRNQTDRDGKVRAFYRIELDRDCQCTTGRGEDTREVTCVKGDIVNVDESAALEDLEPRTRDGGVYDVWIKYGKQQESTRKGQKGFWPADIRLRVIEEPTRDVEKRRAKPSRRDDNRRDDRRFRDDDDHDYGRPTRDRDD